MPSFRIYRVKVPRLAELVLFLLAAAMWAHSAQANELLGVYDQAKYNDLPPGRQYGSLIYSPSISAHETYDDNIYRRPDKQSDLVSTVSPALNVGSDYDMYNFGLSAGGDFGTYLDHSSENYQDYGFAAHGGWTMDHDTSLSASESETKAHEDRSAPDDPGGDRPVEYHLSSQAVNFTRAPGLLKLYVDAGRDELTFEDSSRDGTNIDNSARNRDVYSVQTKLAYELEPGYDVFGAVKYDDRHYLDNGTVDRDSQGYEATLGADVFLTGTLKGNIYAGDLHQSYNEGLPDIDTPDYGGSLLWNVDQLTSVLATLDRAIDETTFAETAGSVDTTANVTVQHSLRDNLFVLGSAGLINSHYETETSIANRTDKDYASGVSLEYLPTGNISADVGYRYTTRHSTDSTADFNDNAVTLTLTYGF